MDLMYDQICVQLKILLLQGTATVLMLHVIIDMCRKYVGQVYCDSLVHDESALKYLVDTMGEVVNSKLL